MDKMLKVSTCFIYNELHQDVYTMVFTLRSAILRSALPNTLQYKSTLLPAPSYDNVFINGISAVQFH
ncbi:hypothetical protein GN244_ATG15047 [Phytophthora infestans]|uniref:Uncharacterized protein n=1 Tax=Phytophthora infestans TaxID=4787 RepID=A0A833WPH8_PHYIN|nr:hypothetical protein GN244_ATG15047 [Phytophthora infestans]KAF4137445.1 hypothetical protein GN958_ATG13351 [Phytophthora infestans]